MYIPSKNVPPKADTENIFAISVQIKENNPEEAAREVEIRAYQYLNKVIAVFNAEIKE